MPNRGHEFRDLLIGVLQSWNTPDLAVYREAWVGSRFLRGRRYVDVVVTYGTRSIGIEAKVQFGEGTADEKLFYALEDCRHAPIPMIIAFTGSHIRQDIQSQLILSGYGVEVETAVDATTQHLTILDASVFQQRVRIVLGLDWLSDQLPRRVSGPGSTPPGHGPR